MERSHIVRVLAPLAFVFAGCTGLEDDGIGSSRLAAKGGKGGGKTPTLSEQLLARGVTSGARCAVQPPSAADQAAIEAATSNGIGLFDETSIVTVPVHWHVITTASGAGNVSALIPAQMRVLNDAYAPSRFRFQLASTRVVANDSWFFARLGSPQESEMKAALRQGGPGDLNIYTTNGDVYLGWATPAFYYNFITTDDGVVLWFAALPGTGLQATGVAEEPDGVLTYDGGDTATHEVGHWLGLDHTFGPGNGCTTPGDKIKDTPTEAFPQFFCAQRDTCTGPAFPGSDPITNYMDYVDDVCMDHFTAEQTKRMRTHWHAFRNKAQ